MKYFVKMTDGEFKNVVVRFVASNGDIYFELENEIFCYTDSERAFRKVCHSGCWGYTNEIDFIFEMDEEDIGLNKLQTTDFNAGMLYAKIEKDTCVLIKDYEERNHTAYTSSYQFTTSQLFPYANYSAKEKSYIVDASKKTVENQFNRVYGHYYELQFSDFPGGSYCVFVYTITRKEEVKELTITEIEEKLGYKIKVVGE